MHAYGYLNVVSCACICLMDSKVNRSQWGNCMMSAVINSWWYFFYSTMEYYSLSALSMMMITPSRFYNLLFCFTITRVLRMSFRARWETTEKRSNWFKHLQCCSNNKRNMWHYVHKTFDRYPIKDISSSIFAIIMKKLPDFFFKKKRNNSYWRGNEIKKYDFSNLLLF